jgi:sigma-E factor negative regulatory protein RseC
MIEEMGRVIAIEPGYAWIETQVKTTCGSCVAQDNCGTGLVAKAFTPKADHVKVAVPDKINVGQSVKIGIPEQQLLSASAMLYIVPLIALIIVATVLHLWLNLAEPVVIILSFFATLMVYWIVSRHLKTQSNHYLPVFLGATHDVTITRKHEIPVKKY